MKKQGVFMIMSVIASASYSQTDVPSFNYGIKLYNLFSYEGSSREQRPTPPGSSYYFYHDESLRILKPTIAFQWRSGTHNYHEISLDEFSWLRTDHATELRNDSLNQHVTVAADKVTESSFSARYEYIVMLRKKKEAKLIPSIGFSANLFYRSTKASPVVSSSFEVSEKTLGVRTYIVPRLNYNAGQHLYFDLNLPLCFTETTMQSNSDSDPAIPQDQRKVSSMDMHLFAKIFSARLGVGIRF